MQKDIHLDVRTRRRLTQVRTILKMRLDLLDKDINVEKRERARQAIDELSLAQLNKLRIVHIDIASAIIAEYNKNAETE